MSSTPSDGSLNLTQALEHAVELLRNEDIEQAEAALNDILRAAPGLPDAQHFLGVLRHTQGRSDEAVALISAALEQVPDNAGAWNNLGNVQLKAGRFDEAARAYTRSVDLAGGVASADALNNLAILHRRQGRLGESEAACRRAIELKPDFASAWYTLSQTLMQQGKVHDALLANSRAITLVPDHVARDQVIRALVLLGERERAAGLYREWLAEDPDNPLALHHLAACLGEDTPDRASDAYVERVFDGFASSFDAKLEKLDYRAPGLVAQALGAAVGAPAAALRIVDVGCGTGLCGPLVRPWASHLAGCDLSVGMLRLARARRVYDVLHKAELVYYLSTQPAAFDAVISADTLCYFGALDNALVAASQALTKGGWLVFTVEALAAGDNAPHRLQPNGRYAHSRAHIDAALSAAGLTPIDVHTDTLRKEAGLSVAGWIVTARKP